MKYTLNLIQIYKIRIILIFIYCKFLSVKKHTTEDFANYRCGLYMKCVKCESLK